LGICHERTYEGEPAMKLESAAMHGRDVLKLKPVIKNNVLVTSQMIWRIFESRSRASVADLAYSAHTYLAKGLATLAIQKAQEHDVKTIGFSGGAACNEILTSVMRKAVETANLRFLVHEAIPPGDGGISFGQSVVGGFFRS
jgi:hydrogenase maturation protein HypF